jgi:hypothetical protein
MIYARLLAARIAFTGQTFRLRAFVRADQEGCSARPCPNLSQSAPHPTRAHARSTRH